MRRYTHILLLFHLNIQISGHTDNLSTKRYWWILSHHLSIVKPMGEFDVDKTLVCKTNIRIFADTTFFFCNPKHIHALPMTSCSICLFYSWISRRSTVLGDFYFSLCACISKRRREQCILMHKHKTLMYIRLPGQFFGVIAMFPFPKMAIITDSKSFRCWVFQISNSRIHF